NTLVSSTNSRRPSGAGAAPPRWALRRRSTGTCLARGVVEAAASTRVAKEGLATSGAASTELAGLAASAATASPGTDLAGVDLSGADLAGADSSGAALAGSESTEPVLIDSSVLAPEAAAAGAISSSSV